MTSVMIYAPSTKYKDNKNPFQIFADDRLNVIDTFYCLCSELNSLFDNVYLKIEPTNVVESNKFSGLFKILPDNSYEYISTEVEIDIIFDKSLNLGFTEMAEKFCTVSTNLPLKKLACDKWESYDFLPQHFPKTFLIRTNEDFGDIVDKLDSGSKYVLKPRYGSKGSGIFIDFPGQLSKILDSNNISGDYILQEFRDTSNGVDSIIEGKHDIRFYVVNRKIIVCYVRTPVGESDISNLALGGSLKYIHYSLFNRDILDSVEQIINKIDSKFPNSFYSVDFGIDSGGELFLYELNTSMVTPVYSKDAEVWANKLANFLFDKMLAALVN